MKKRKFDDGGSVTPQDVEDMKMRARATRAYDKAMPSVDKIFNSARPSSAPGKYDSVRKQGFEEGVDAEKANAIKQGLRGAGMVAKNIGMTAIPGGAFATDPHETMRGMKMARGAVNRYGEASDRQSAADRELEDQVRRESRGVEYKKGGFVRAADGIAKKGKTKGRML